MAITLEDFTLWSDRNGFTSAPHGEGHQARPHVAAMERLRISSPSYCSLLEFNSLVWAIIPNFGLEPHSRAFLDFLRIIHG